MNFTETILNGVKNWVENKFSKVENKFSKIEKDLANKQPVGDYVLKRDIPVTSVNEQTGDVYLTYDMLEDLPFSSSMQYKKMAYVDVTTNRQSIAIDGFIPGNTYKIIIYDEYWDPIDEYNELIAKVYNHSSMGAWNILSIGGDPFYFNRPVIIYSMGDYTKNNTEYIVGINENVLELPLNIGIYEKREVVNTLDEKFIPDTVARVEDIPEVDYPVASVNGMTGEIVIDIPSISGLATEEFATNAANAIKNDLLNGAGEAYNTLKELGDLIDENTDALEVLETVATNKLDIATFAEHLTDTELTLSSPSGKKFKITIDDDGVLTATEIVESAT